MTGRKLELLRSHTIPGAIAASWTANPLRGPVAALPLGNGPTALVLDSPGGRSWRLAQVDLATGKTGREWSQPQPAKTSLGDPSTMAFEPNGDAVLVASAVGQVWQVHRVDLASGRVTRLISGLDGSTELGPVRGIVSLGTDVALITAGSSLIRLDFGPGAPPRATTLFDDLATPWGIATDPLQDQRVYVAEHGADRVIRIELDTYIVDEVFTDPLTLPGEGLERPRAIALERNGARLLAVTDANPGDGTRELRAVDVGGRHTGVVFELAKGLPGDGARAGGGARPATPARAPLMERSRRWRRRAPAALGRRLRPRGSDGDRDRCLRSAADPERSLAHDRRAGPGKSSPTGQDNVFVWDSTDVPEGSVALRIIPLDTDVGLDVAGLAEKRIRSFQAPFTVGSRSDRVQSIVAADMDGDGHLDLASATLVRKLVIFYQEPPGRSRPRPRWDPSRPTPLLPG